MSPRNGGSTGRCGANGGCGVCGSGDGILRVVRWWSEDDDDGASDQKLEMTMEGPEEKKHPSLPSNYISLAHLKDRWLQQHQQQQKLNDDGVISVPNSSSNRTTPDSSTHRHQPAKNSRNAGLSKPEQVGAKFQDMLNEADKLACLESIPMRTLSFLQNRRYQEVRDGRSAEVSEREPMGMQIQDKWNEVDESTLPKSLPARAPPFRQNQAVRYGRSAKAKEPEAVETEMQAEVAQDERLARKSKLEVVNSIVDSDYLFLVVDFLQLYSVFSGDLDLMQLSSQLRRFSWREIQLATNNFSGSNIIGQGGFGKVYKGVLSDNTTVAVKRLTDYQSPGGEAAFLREVHMISVAVHRNLLRLVGVCTTSSEKILVYPFMQNLSVAYRLREVHMDELPVSVAGHLESALGTPCQRHASWYNKRQILIHLTEYKETAYLDKNTAKKGSSLLSRQLRPLTISCSPLKCSIK
ncbi:hypothetical protein RJ639_035500 [Escallonia herrerae]|uniref:non-specific serine/threonine protein kinase n=1 Tax=Escallonia herrerae TaxID=1293975 RepID=A0AA88WSY8_9ASTE|nr:hypothetical protein RJ639_035500 [Escallonia herrerae]